jgi:8-oxo-dGTP pyrophosphatase MutT (NUDIX family)
MSRAEAASLEVGQIAALPIKWDEKGRLRILMVTSRGTGRWVLPKGWPMDGKKPWHAAEIEALEEAGAVGCIGDEALGEYGYVKDLGGGTRVPVRVKLYPMIVDGLKKRWKERGDRTRKWFSVKGAAKRVDEPELQRLLLSLADKPHKKNAIKQVLRKAT